MWIVCSADWRLTTGYECTRPEREIENREWLMGCTGRAKPLSYTDSTPLTSGSYIGLRTINTRARFDDVQANEMALSYLHGDHLGSNSLMTDATGAVVPNSQAAYLPFGDWRNEPTTASLTDLGYTSHRHNNTASNDLGLIYMNARYYIPSLARFASADTLIPEPTNPQSYNRFSYVLNNPIIYIDSTGHFTEEAITEYVTNEICGDRPTSCIEDTLASWKSNSLLWQLLLAAQGGDVAFVGIRNGVFAGGLFYRFDGGGGELWGITISDIYGGLVDIYTLFNQGVTSDLLHNVTIDDLMTGRHNLDWGGFIRWRSLENSDSDYLHPEFKARADLTIEEGNFKTSIIADVIINLLDPIDWASIFLGPQGNKWITIRGDNWDYGFAFTFYHSGINGDWQFKSGRYYYPNSGLQYPTGPIYGYFPHSLSR